MEVEVPASVNFQRLQDAGDAPYKVLEGSSGSGKTYSVIQYLICRALAERVRITAFRHDQATCRDSIIADFTRIMTEQFRLWDPKCWNGSPVFEYRFPNGSVFQFRGSSNPAKLHGPRRDVAWLNEVMEISYDAYRQIAMRTSRDIIMDYNPSYNRHWVFDRILPREDVAYIHSTFRDNPMLPDASKAEILALEPTPENQRRGTADQWAWEVYGLGKRGRREGAIFKHWWLIDPEEFPARHLCQRHAFAMDFGFSADPTAVVEMAIWNDNLYAREWVYETELVAQQDTQNPGIPSIEGRLRELEIPRESRIHVDNARPEITRVLTNAGFKCVPTVKTPDSILAGLDRLKGMPLYVSRSSQNLQAELESYTWAKDAHGVWLEKPEDRNNHCIDAMRYWALAEMQPLRKPRKGGKRGTVARPSGLGKW